MERASGGARGRIHPATRTFQALRIAVNDELDTLQRALGAAVGSLAPGGRLAVISFHSLEDRIVKQFIARESATCICPPEQPVCTCNAVPRLKPVGKPIKPSEEEIERNSRSRSAIMRVAERLSEREFLCPSPLPSGLHRHPPVELLAATKARVMGELDPDTEFRWIERNSREVYAGGSLHRGKGRGP